MKRHTTTPSLGDQERSQSQVQKEAISYRISLAGTEIACRKSLLAARIPGPNLGGGAQMTKW